MSIQRILSKVDASGDCWEWTAGKAAAGYGYVWWNGTMKPAHRVLYELLVGEVDKPQLDHLCRNRACVNPDHLEPVTASENALRGATGRYRRPDRCKRNHDLTNERNIYRHRRRRHCRLCKTLRAR